MRMELEREINDLKFTKNQLKDEQKKLKKQIRTQYSDRKSHRKGKYELECIYLEFEDKYSRLQE